MESVNKVSLLIFFLISIKTNINHIDLFVLFKTSRDPLLPPKKTLIILILKSYFIGTYTKFLMIVVIDL